MNSTSTRYSIIANRERGTLHTVPHERATALVSTGSWFLVCSEPDDLAYTPPALQPTRRACVQRIPHWLSGRYYWPLAANIRAPIPGVSRREWTAEEITRERQRIRRALENAARRAGQPFDAFVRGTVVPAFADSIYSTYSPTEQALMLASVCPDVFAPKGGGE